MTEELYKKYRPRSFKQIVGQDAAVRMLCDLGKRNVIPHTILFSGPSGCGKTTLARILRVRLRCADEDFYEQNCADFRGIDMVREIRSRVGYAPMGGRSRVWLIDEAHRLTADAQHAFLKLLEDTPSHVYFFLATTEPQKLLKTVRTRATEVKVRPLNDGEMDKLLADVIEAEGAPGYEDVLRKIIESAEGSPRKALVLLNQVIGLGSEEEQLAAIEAADAKAEAIQICRLLMNPRAKWSEMAKVLKAVEGEPEQLRHLVLAYFTTVLLGGKGWGFDVIRCFEEPFYNTGKAGLVAACWDAVCRSTSTANAD